MVIVIIFDFMLKFMFWIFGLLYDKNGVWKDCVFVFDILEVLWFCKCRDWENKICLMNFFIVFMIDYKFLFEFWVGL